MVAVLLAATASMVIAAIWYSPIAFGNPWLKAMGLTLKSLKGEQKRNVGRLYSLSFGASLVAAVVLAVMIATLDISTISDGLLLSFWMWLGFCMTTQYSTWLFSGKSASLYLINIGYQLVAFLTMGLILSFVAG